LQHIEQLAVQHKLQSLFVLSTQTSHWFLERGFRKADIKDLPMKRKELYNYRRNSMVYFKPLEKSR